MKKKSKERATNGVKLNFTDDEFGVIMRAFAKDGTERTIGPWVRKAALRVARET